MKKLPRYKESSLDDPIAFFESFFETDYVASRLLDFMPDLHNPDHWFRQSAIHEDYEKEEYTTRHEVPVKGHSIEIDPGNPIWIVDEIELVEVTHSFEKHLQEIIVQEADNTLYFLNKIFKSSTAQRSKNLCKIIIDQLMQYRKKVTTDETFAKYPHLKNSIDQLIKKIYQKYPSVFPKSANNKELSELLFATHHLREKKERRNKDKEKHSKGVQKKFKPSIFSALSKFNYKGQYIFDDNEDDDASFVEKQKKFAQSLKSMALGDFKNASPIKFVIEVQAAHYILRRLKDSFKDLQLTKLSDENLIRISETPLNAVTNYTRASEFSKDVENKLKIALDTLFREHEL